MHEEMDGKQADMAMNSFMSSRTTATKRAGHRSAMSILATEAVPLPTVANTKPTWSTTERIWYGRAACNFIYDDFRPEPSKVTAARRHAAQAQLAKARLASGAHSEMRSANASCAHSGPG